MKKNNYILKYSFYEMFLFFNLLLFAVLFYIYVIPVFSPLVLTDRKSCCNEAVL